MLAECSNSQQLICLIAAEHFAFLSVNWYGHVLLCANAKEIRSTAYNLVSVIVILR